jgi:hypothetical protein
MSRDFPEADWKIFRVLQPIARERYSNQAISELRKILSDGSRPSGQRFWDAFEAAKLNAREIREIFDDFRRSTALLKLLQMRSRGLIRDNEMSRFSEETQKAVKKIAGSFE